MTITTGGRTIHFSNYAGCGITESIYNDAAYDNTAVTEVMASDIVSVAPTDTVSDALERMLEEDVEHLPVLDAERLVGICTRTDVMRARSAQHAHEQPEPGWLQRPRRRAS